MSEESKIFGVSVRGWLTIIIIVTVCVLSFTDKDMAETLKFLASACAGFYWGQKTKV